MHYFIYIHSQLYMFIGQRRSVTIQRSIEAVETYSELRRHQEEKGLLIREMKNMLHYYHQSILPSLSLRISGCYT